MAGLRHFAVAMPGKGLSQDRKLVNITNHVNVDISNVLQLMVVQAKAGQVLCLHSIVQVLLLG